MAASADRKSVLQEADVQQLSDLWSSLSIQRRVVVVVASVAMFAAVLGLARLAAQPNLTLLYSGLDGAAAGEVVSALDQQGVQYEVRGGAIFVDSVRRDELRMILAGEGLPRNSGQGYELLDGLTGFGTTSRMFDAAYWRAKEGELARTIAAAPQVASARVHIANAAPTPFRRELRPTASVFVTGSGGTVTPANAKAFRYLVASAVSGLAPDDVSVIDANGELIGAAEDDAPATGSDERAGLLRERVQRLLEARVGAGNAVVEVSVETVTDSESIRERRIDPEQRVAISTETEERSASSKNTDMGGDVTVASNLPDGDAASGGGDSATQDSESRERVNYEVSEIERELIRAPGAVRRITVAALVNGVAGPDSEALSPRDEGELTELRDLIASAVGFDESRGDEITIKSMPFQPLAELGTAAAQGWADELAMDATRLIQIGVLAVVALILGLFVVRPVLTRSGGDLPQLEAPDGALTGEVDDGDFALPDLPIVSGFDGGLPSFDGDAASDPVARLRDLIGERQTETVEVLRSWLEDGKERA